MRRSNKWFWMLVALLVSNCYAFSQIERIYLLPGQGSDYRIFDSLQIDNSIEKVFVKYPTPYPMESLEEYAKRVSSQIDTTGRYALLGVSFGGMLAVEISKIRNPEITFLVSSAKTRSELPKPLKSLKQFPINKGIPAFLYKSGSFVAQPIFESDRRKNKATFKAMLKDKDPKFLKQVTSMISNWENETIPSQVFHIHGDNDNTLPIKNLKPDVIIEEGSHMMMLTKGTLVSGYIQEKLNSL